MRVKILQPVAHAICDLTTQSQLAQALCAEESGLCTFPSEVVLPAHLSCYDAFASTYWEAAHASFLSGWDAMLPRSNECQIDEPRLVRLVEPTNTRARLYNFVSALWRGVFCARFCCCSPI